MEAGATQGWHRYIGQWGDVIGLDHFGASAPGPVLMGEFGFTAENVCKCAHSFAGKEQRTMPDPLTGLPRTLKPIGIAADHGGYELKEYLVRMLRDAGHEVIDFGDGQPNGR